VGSVPYRSRLVWLYVGGRVVIFGSQPGTLFFSRILMHLPCLLRCLFVAGDTLNNEPRWSLYWDSVLIAVYTLVNAQQRSWHCH
jgi:hypothetical protein